MRIFSSRRSLFPLSRSLTSWVILSLIALLVVVAVASGAAYVYLRFVAVPSAGGPLEWLRTERIDPSLSLLTLTGVSDADVVDMALASDAIDTAHAIVFFRAELSDRERAGSLLLLGQAYLAAGDRSMARRCYQQASLITTLSPSLSDFNRASTYLDIGQGLADGGNRSEALSNYDQAYVVALDSVYLRDPHRADVLGALVSAYRALGENAKAEECAAQQAAFKYVLPGDEESKEPPPPQPACTLAMEAPEPAAAMITSYEQRRVESVRELVDALQDTPREQISDDLMTDVARALTNEDSARRSAYEQQLAGASSMVLKTAIAKARLDWLTVKYQIALGGYGLQLVPEWTQDLAGIESELNAAYLDFRSSYGEQIDTLSEAAAVDRAWYCLVRFEVEQGRLGLYPDYPQEELLSQLTEIGERLVASGDLSLHVQTRYEDDTPLFTLVTPE
jgi:tetratricopeptide (TPR) repeat protein